MQGGEIFGASSSDENNTLRMSAFGLQLLYKHYHFKNTKLLPTNDHVIDILTSEDMENILLCTFSFCLYYIII